MTRKFREGVGCFERGAPAGEKIFNDGGGRADAFRLAFSKHDGGTHNGPLGYSIRSLYFDSWNDGDFFGKVDGLELRRKIRLRIYSPSAKTAKLEMKQKEGPYQKKRSLTMGREDAQALIQGKYEVPLNYEEPFAAECYGLMQMEQYRPRTIVEYRRKAFIAKENRIRITLDRDIIATESCINSFSAPVPGAGSVLCSAGGEVQRVSAQLHQKSDQRG